MSTNPDEDFAGFCVPQWAEEGVPEDNNAEPEDAEVPDNDGAN